MCAARVEVTDIKRNKLPKSDERCCTKQRWLVSRAERPGEGVKPSLIRELRYTRLCGISYLEHLRSVS